MSLYLAAAFVLPDDSERGHDVVDLRRYYYDNAPWLFGTLAVSPALDAVRRGIQAGTMLDNGAWSNGVAAVLLATMGVIRKPWYHAVVTLIVASLFLSFIVSSALLLR